METTIVGNGWVVATNENYVKVVDRNGTCVKYNTNPLEKDKLDEIHNWMNKSKTLHHRYVQDYIEKIFNIKS